MKVNNRKDLLIHSHADVQAVEFWQRVRQPAVRLAKWYKRFKTESMIQFDRSSIYQFILFFKPEPEQPWPLTEARQLPNRLAQQPQPSLPKLNLSFEADPLVGKGTATYFASQFESFPVLTWRGKGGGPWALSWNPLRMDLNFDARAYADLHEKEHLESVEAIVSRVTKNLSECPEITKQKVNRLAMIQIAGASDKIPDNKDLVGHVVKRFMNESFANDYKEDRLEDCTAKVTHTEKHQFSGMENEIELLKIVTWASQMGFNNDTLQKEISFTYQLDINTSPRHLNDTVFSKQAIADFFTLAKEWIIDEQSKFIQAEERK
jgi:hypothetical protein